MGPLIFLIEAYTSTILPNIFTVSTDKSQVFSIPLGIAAKKPYWCMAYMDSGKGVTDSGRCRVRCGTQDRSSIFLVSTILEAAIRFTEQQSLDG